MFLYLNTCPIKDKAEFYLKDFFRQVFTKFVFEPTNSGIILYTLSAMKFFQMMEEW